MNNRFLLSTNVVIPSGFAGGLLAYITGNFTPLLLIMLTFCFFDYIVTILVAIRKTGKLTRDEIIWNLIQKVFYFMIVTIAFGLDYTIYQSTIYLYGEVQLKAYFGMACIAILIATEGLDILINLEEFDIKIPFLKKGLKLFKDKIQGDKK